MKHKNTGLGRGLGALLSSDNDTMTIGGAASICEVDIDLIAANPEQPRRDFDETALNELAESIKQVGIIQPITLRQQPDGNYLIIAGERRWRAAQKAELETIPAYVRPADDAAIMEMALIENIQRENLNAIEEALAYAKLMEQSHLTQEEVAVRVGKNRATIANFLRLLKLPAEIQLAIKNKSLSMGHARAMLPLENPELQMRLFHLTIANDYSVRQVEKLVRDLLEGKISDFEGAPNKSSEKAVGSNELFAAMESHLAQLFSTKVKMTCNEKGQGRIAIGFKNDQELQHIIQLLDKVGIAEN